MTDARPGKIQNLLEQAARQRESSQPLESSVASATRVFSDVTEAENVFFNLRKRLLRVELWNRASEISSFHLFDRNGNAAPEKTAAEGDFIKIILPGSGKDDWVKITEIHDSADEIVLTVQPSPDPTAKETDETTSHFFTSDSTNNFCLQKNDAKINFYVIGLSERTNTEDTSGIIESARNFATANAGSLLGIQKFQWETFCENFLELRSGN
jgi:hypothetical protein